MSGSCAYQIDPAQQSKDCPTITTSTSNVLYNHMQLIPFPHWPKFVQFRFVLLYKQTVQHASYIQTRMHTINLRWQRNTLPIDSKDCTFQKLHKPSASSAVPILAGWAKEIIKNSTNIDIRNRLWSRVLSIEDLGEQKLPGPMSQTIEFELPAATLMRCTKPQYGHKDLRKISCNTC